jgi:hypothetical protein
MFVQPAYQPPPQTAAMPMPAPVAMPAPTPPAPVAMDFQGFMQGLTQRMAGNASLNAEYLGTVVQRVSAAYQQPLNAITDISNFPHMIEYAVATMVQDGRW